MRLDFIVHAGVPTRTLKAAQALVRAGEVAVDGVVEQEPKRQIVPGVEAVSHTGTPLRCAEHVFYLLHKPAGHLSQRHPREPNVYELIPAALRRDDLAAVGRLDRDTTGALLLGTDSGLQALLAHPTSRVWKTYTARIGGTIASDAAARFEAGLELEDGVRCAPASLEVLDGGRAVRVKLHEGFFHQVKRMVAAVGGTVEQLHRDAVGPLRVDGGDGEALPPGSMRALTPAERRALVDLLPTDRVARAVLPAEIEERRRPNSGRVGLVCPR